MADLKPDQYKAIFRAATNQNAPRVTHGRVPLDVQTTDVKGVFERAKAAVEKQQNGNAPVVKGDDWRNQQTANPIGVSERAARAELARRAHGGR